MDGKDVQLIRLLQADGRDSFESLGRKLGLSGTAVRTRLIRLKEENVVPDFGLQVSPLIFDRKRVTLEMADAFAHGKEEEILECIRELPWSDAVFNRDESLALLIWYKKKSEFKRERDALMKKISKCSGRKIGTAREFYGVYLSERTQRMKLTNIEKRVIKALSEGPRDQMKFVAKRAKHSQRVVRESIRRLAEENMVRVVPNIQPAWAQGMELFGLLIYSKDPDVLAEAQRQVPDHEISGHLTEPPGIGLWVWTNSLADQLRIRSAVRETGVDEVAVIKPVRVVRRLPPGYL